MTGRLPSFFKETIGAMLNLCLTVYVDGMLNTNSLIDGCQNSISSNSESVANMQGVGM